MEYTDRLHLAKPSRDDTVLVDRDVSGNMQAIDDAILADESAIAIPENGDVASQALYQKHIIRNGELYYANNISKNTEFQPGVNILRVCSNGLVNSLANRFSGIESLYNGRIRQNEPVSVPIPTSSACLLFTSGPYAGHGSSSVYYFDGGDSAASYYPIIPPQAEGAASPYITVSLVSNHYARVAVTRNDEYNPWIYVSVVQLGSPHLYKEIEEL